MAKAPLTVDSRFEVNEEKALNIVVAVLYFLVASLGLVWSTKEKSWVAAAAIVGVVVFPGLVYFLKSRSQRIFIRIDKTGIYQDENLVTTWTNFLKAYVREEPPSMSMDMKRLPETIKDQFFLIIEYLKDDSGNGSRRRIRLTNTQNKSDEEIMEAITFFARKYATVNLF